MQIAPTIRAASSLVFVCGALLAIGCSDDPLAPSAVAGTYALRSVDGRALPTPVGNPGPNNESVTVIADTLRLAADGSGSRVRVEEIVGVPGLDDGSLTRFESTLHFRTTKGGLAITFDCPPNALMLCAAGPHMTARLAATGLIATQLLGSASPELVYASVP